MTICGCFFSLVVVLVCLSIFHLFFLSCKLLLHIFSFIAETKKKKNCMKSKRVFGYSSQEYEEEDLAYDTPERKKKQKGEEGAIAKWLIIMVRFLFLRV